MTELCNQLSKRLAQAAESFYNSDGWFEHLFFLYVWALPETTSVKAQQEL